jgi:hypothetical protein
LHFTSQLLYRWHSISTPYSLIAIPELYERPVFRVRKLGAGCRSNSEFVEGIWFWFISECHYYQHRNINILVFGKFQLRVQQCWLTFHEFCPVALYRWSGVTLKVGQESEEEENDRIWMGTSRRYIVNQKMRMLLSSGMWHHAVW